MRNFPRQSLGNAHGRNNLLSFLALPIREISLLSVPTEDGGMEIIMKNEAKIEKLIERLFFIALSRPRQGKNYFYAGRKV